MTEPLRILVIEDSPTQLMNVCNLLRGVMNGRTWEPVPAETLARAKERLATGRIDVILADLYLPDSDVATTLEWLATAGPPFSVMTDRDSQAAIELADASGARRFVSKREPLRETHLKIAVYAALAAKARQEQSALAARMQKA